VKSRKKKDLNLNIRISREEIEMANRQAKVFGLTVSAYIRMLLHREENLKK